MEYFLLCWNIGSIGTLSILTSNEFQNGNIVFKMQSIASNDYSIEPSCGIIRPSSSAKIRSILPNWTPSIVQAVSTASFDHK
jgi:hypothetical protein